MRIALSILTVLFLVHAAGCPRSTRRTLVPTAERLEEPSSGDASARARFRDARARFERDERQLSTEFEAIAREYPEDPIVPYALLYAGIAAVKERAYDQALDNLTRAESAPEVDAKLRNRARLFLGITYNYQGRHREALEHLRAGQGSLENEDDMAEWFAAMAEATSQTGAPLAAVPYYGRWYEVASEAERAYILVRLETIASEAPAAEVEAAYDNLEQRKGPAAAILGSRVATDLAARGQESRADQIRRDIDPIRRDLGLLPAPEPSASGQPGRLGAVLPLSGRRAQAGDLAMRGLALAAGTFRDLGVDGVRRFDVSVRDTASEVAGTRTAVDAVAGEGVIAVVGPLDGDSVDAASQRAHALGLPLISLNPRSGASSQSSPYVFHIMQSAEDRAQALARHAHGKGVRTFAVLRPDDGYGRVVSKAFVDEIERLGGRVVTQVAYAPNATSFGDVIGKLGSSWDAVFVPDQADRLELIAPALAAADLVSQPLGAKAPRTGRGILLLSTAEFIAPKYLRSAGRYSEGAVLAPGFYPDRADAILGEFVGRYERAFGKLPTPLEAYAYDAAQVVAAALEAGARARGQLGDRMAAGVVQGLTGNIAFDGRRRRKDNGLLFTVTRDQGGLAIRAMRD